MAARNAEKQIPPEPHWGFCYTMLHKVSRSFGLVIQQLGPELRSAVCIFYLVLRALVTLDLLIESVCPNGSKPKEYNYLGLSSDCSSVDSSVPIPSFSDETKTNLYLKATELTKNTEEVDGKVEGKDKCVVLWSIHDHISTLAAETGSNVKQGSKVGVNSEKATESPSIGPQGIYQGHADTVEDVQFCPSRDKVVDFHWNASDPWTIVSVSDDCGSTGGGGTLQVWRMIDLIYRPEEEVMAELDKYKPLAMELMKRGAMMTVLSA